MVLPLTLAIQPAGQVVPSGVIGFASINALGQNGTIGGGIAPPIVVTTQSELVAAISGRIPKVVHVLGHIPGSGKVAIGSNTTILGLGATGFIDGFTLAMGDSGGNVQNIIIRNIRVANDSGDMITAEADTPSGTHHIWIDHVTFDGPGGDGAIDITQGSTYSTISWCHFIGCDKTMLTGRAGFDEDGTGRWTVHHNWFEGCRQRQPITQEFGWAHCFNNYYDIDPSFFSRAIDIGHQAHAYVEQNYFKHCPSCVRARTSSNKVRDGGGNVFDNSSPFSEQDPDNCFVPVDWYNYVPDPGGMINTLIPAGAGAGNI